LSVQELEGEIEQAHREIAAWTKAPSRAWSDAEMVEAVSEWAWTEYGLGLKTEWNPGLSAFEARWVRGESVANWFKRAFTADAIEPAQLLACAGLLHVIAAVNADTPKTRGF
jgi:hypothetical protein